jgi:hypothetical protein
MYASAARRRKARGIDPQKSFPANCSLAAIRAWLWPAMHAVCFAFFFYDCRIENNPLIIRF